ncbi:MAG: cache domain-containing protein [Lentimicrobiaceae bacterium]|nr:cache domain-containing protein [Lentimicrobiaceae bacterium]
MKNKFSKRIRTYLENKSFTWQMTNAILVLSFFLLIIAGVIWTKIKTIEFKQDKARLQSEYIESQKQLIETEVNRSMAYIKYRRSLTIEQMKSQLKVRVDGAWQIANNIYLENRNRKPAAEIQQMIKDAIRPLRFANERGDVFIYTVEGVAVMLPRSREQEGKPSLHHKDNSGNYVVQNEVNLLRMLDNGFIDYHISNHNKPGDSVLLKSTYVRKFEPFGWYLGSKDYLEDYNEELKAEILDWLSQIRYGEDGYIFVNTNKGEGLIYDGRKMPQPVNIYNSRNLYWIEAYRMQQKIYNTTRKGFINYEFRLLASDNIETKISYVNSLQDWGWIIGAGFYNSTIAPQIALMEQQSSQLKQQTLIIIVLICLLIFSIIFLMSRWFSRRLLRGFSNFNMHFRNASLTGSEMNPSDFNSLEFKELAKSFNTVSVELNHARKQLIKEQSLLRSLIDSSPDLIFFKDAESNFVGCNKAFSDYIGISEEELVGKNDNHFFPTELAEQYNQSDEDLLRTGVPIRNEQWIVTSNGNRQLMDTVKVLNHDKDGNILGILGISRDITDREIIQQNYKKAKEKAEEADRLKTAFLANMSHEIRTPLNSIIGFAGLLSEADVNEEDKAEFFKHINQGSEALLNLIDDIIDIAKIEAGQLAVSIEKCDLKTMMDELYWSTTEFIRKREKTNSITLHHTTQLPSAAQIIYTDPFRLKQVISNLLVNAVKFTDKGKIEFGAYQTNGLVHFYVKDTGIGISSDRQKVIFERFMQEHKSGAHHQGGTGLGLAISRHIVELLGGEITLESEMGKGSTFSFSIPFTPVNAENIQDKIVHENIRVTQNWEHKTLLVVEDVDSNYNYINAALSRTGIHLLRARNGNEGTELCKQHNDINMVLMDVGIPTEDGYNTLRAIKNLRPTLPVVAQTSYARQSGFINAGFDDVIPKPVKLVHLIKIMNTWIK